MAHPAPLLIRAQNLTKSYAMGDQIVHALRGVSVDIHAGDFVAIMGASGSGKSTLMNILGCLDLPTQGLYELAGEAVQGMQPDQLASIRNRRIGFVFQQFNLLPRTSAVENVELPMVYAGVPSAARRERAMAGDQLASIRNRRIGFVFQQFNLLPRTSALENVELPMVYAGVKAPDRRARSQAALQRVGLGERGEHTPSELSGGQQQRVAIARALVNNPQLILADEPTGALDSKTSEDIMRLLDELNQQGMTVVIVTHEADIAAWARRKLVFRDGQIVEDVRQPGHSRASAPRQPNTDGHPVLVEEAQA